MKAAFSIGIDDIRGFWWGSIQHFIVLLRKGTPESDFSRGTAKQFYLNLLIWGNVAEERAFIPSAIKLRTEHSLSHVGFQILPCIGFLVLHHLLRRPLCHQLTTSIAPFRAKIDQPVCNLYDINIVFND